MTEAERRAKFNEALDLLCQEHAVRQIVVSQECSVTLPDGSQMDGIRRFIHVVVEPMDSPPPQVEKQAKT